MSLQVRLKNNHAQWADEYPTLAMILQSSLACDERFKSFVIALASKLAENGVLSLEDVLKDCANISDVFEKVQN